MLSYSTSPAFFFRGRLGKRGSKALALGARVAAAAAGAAATAGCAPCYDAARSIGRSRHDYCLFLLPLLASLSPSACLDSCLRQAQENKTRALPARRCQWCRHHRVDRYFDLIIADLCGSRHFLRATLKNVSTRLFHINDRDPDPFCQALSNTSIYPTPLAILAVFFAEIWYGLICYMICTTYNGSYLPGKICLCDTTLARISSGWDLYDRDLAPISYDGTIIRDLDILQ